MNDDTMIEQTFGVAVQQGTKRYPQQAFALALAAAYLLQSWYGFGRELCINLTSLYAPCL